MRNFVRNFIDFYRTDHGKELLVLMAGTIPLACLLTTSWSSVWAIVMLLMHFNEPAVWFSWLLFVLISCVFTGLAYWGWTSLDKRWGKGKEGVCDNCFMPVGENEFKRGTHVCNP